MIIAELPKKTKFRFFVGIDISRNELDFAVMDGAEFLFHREIENNPPEIAAFIQELKSMPGFSITKALFCMEHTGIYGNHILYLLHAFKAHIIVEDPLHLKNSMGFNRGKSDKIDAIRIAKYAARFGADLRRWVPKRAVIQKLTMLMTLRGRMVKITDKVQTPLKEQTTFTHPVIVDLSNALSSRTINALKADLYEIESTIDLIIAKDEKLQRLYDIIISVPGVGRVTAIMIIIFTNEFKSITQAKKFACYSGVVPFIQESGIYKGKAKISQVANKKMKSLLHICAMSAMRVDPEIKQYYLRKTVQEGKPKMTVINAIRNKLVLRIFACLNQNRLYEASYTCSTATKIGISMNR